MNDRIPFVLPLFTRPSNHMRFSSFPLAVRHWSSVIRHLLFAVSALFLLFAPALPAHPLQAEPIDHPYVFTFDQFHIQEDPDETVVAGGLLLMAETNCIACHAAPEPWRQQLAPRPGPNLAAACGSNTAEVWTSTPESPSTTSADRAGSGSITRTRMGLARAVWSEKGE